MISGCPFLYQTFDGDIYHISDVITQITSSSLPETTNIVAFVDADAEKSNKPDSILTQSRVQIILASSPKGTQQYWPKQKQYKGSVLEYAMALWSASEFFITGFVVSLCL